MQRRTINKLATGWKPKNVEEFEEYFGDLPDGAYFAAAEELGINLFPEDDETNDNAKEES